MTRASGRLKLHHHLGYAAGTQFHMDGVQLRFAGGGDPDSNRLEAALAALIDGDARLIESGRMALHHFQHQLVQVITGIAQDLDRVVGTGKFNLGRLWLSHEV